MASSVTNNYLCPKQKGTRPFVRGRICECVAEVKIEQGELNC